MKFTQTTILTILSFLLSATTSAVLAVPTAARSNLIIARQVTGTNCNDYSGSEWVWLDDMPDYIEAACTEMVGDDGKHLGAEDKLEYTGKLDGDPMTATLHVKDGPMNVSWELCVEVLKKIDEDCTHDGWLHDSFSGGSRTVEHEGARLKLKMDPVD